MFFQYIYISIIGNVNNNKINYTQIQIGACAYIEQINKQIMLEFCELQIHKLKKYELIKINVQITRGTKQAIVDF